MSAIVDSLGRKLANFAIYAYQTLVLSFFFMSALLFSTREGGWINEFIVFLILSSAFAIAPIYRRLRKEPEGSGLESGKI